MKVRLDVKDNGCSVRITSEGVWYENNYVELDIRVAGGNLKEALAAAINRFQELQNEALQKLREAGIMRGVDVMPEVVS